MTKAEKILKKIEDGWAEVIELVTDEQLFCKRRQKEIDQKREAMLSSILTFSRHDFYCWIVLSNIRPLSPLTPTCRSLDTSLKIKDDLFPKKKRRI
jgi:hypothetical protein